MASSSPDSTTAKVKIPFTGAPSTLLITLYSRCLDALAPIPHLNDQHVTNIVPNVDYDFSQLGITAGTVATVVLRSKLLDDWITDFLSKHSSATVLHLACGLDTRALRLKWGEGVRWIDIDLPEVVEVRRKLVPEPEGGRDYTLLAGSVTDPEFVMTLPNDRPTVVVMEGLTMYLEPEDGKKMISVVCGHLEKEGGELVLDCLGWLALSIQGFYHFTKQTSSTLRWAIDDTKVLQEEHKGLEVLDVVPLCSLNEAGRWPFFHAGKPFMWIGRYFAATRGFIRYLRYRF
ncbi:S-adenosyl-L-methionine-dependent methyltransferase [Podospora aff. communis PSN243]|uniref:S-adenosyl-L-methionine-dependent methyltransferase n=1 Tax=Podospora aff. communis PSN243 TaxID=3040156 RepID=A0AAV9GXS8_9PEZI|nr:S-adenosyl-L-methionine-dependent methyltransferase [Podospora aff. communis PSN243]